MWCFSWVPCGALVLCVGGNRKKPERGPEKRTPGTTPIQYKPRRIKKMLKSIATIALVVVLVTSAGAIFLEINK